MIDTGSSLLFTKEEVCPVAEVNHIDCDELFSYLDETWNKRHHFLKPKRNKLRTINGNPSLLKFFNNDISR